jgi:hypothetical protein
MSDTPTPGDPVMLFTMGGVQYYLGPLNSDGLPNFNKDKYINNEVKNNGETIYSQASLETPLFLKEKHKRLQKFLNPKLDTPIEWSAYESEKKNNPEIKPPFISNVVHGDLILEGRHGNSLRIGSRNIHPYLIISNGRDKNNPVETSRDGTILAILEKGSIRDHFNNDGIFDTGETSIDYRFTLADDEIPTVYKSISKTFSKPLGSGRKVDEDNNSNISSEIYDYNENQFFLSSDRITFNAKKDSIFLSAYKHLHFGCGNSMTFSTSKNILFESAESCVTNVPLYKIHSDSVYIDGRQKVIIGNPALNDNIQKAVVGMGLVSFLTTLINEIKTLALATSEAIENRGSAGSSVDIMTNRVDALDNLLGMVSVENTLFEEGDSYEIPETMMKLILSDKVFIKK